MPLAAAIACGLVAALFYLSVLTGSPGSLILVYLVQLPLFGAGLSLGVKATAIAGGTATLATALASGPGSGALFLITEAVPVALLVFQALRRRIAEPLPAARDAAPAPADDVWLPSGQLVVALIALGVAVLVGAAIVLSTPAQGFRGIVQDFLTGELGQLFTDAGMSAQEGKTQAADVARVLAPFFPAMAVGSWLAMIVVNGSLAQGALARFALNRRPSPDIARLELPRWLVGPLACALLLAVLASGDVAYLGGNLLPVLGLAYVFGGLAVLHTAVRRYAGRLFVLVPAYVALLLGWPILVLAGCGMIDQWFGLRSRFAVAAPRQGEE